MKSPIGFTLQPPLQDFTLDNLLEYISTSGILEGITRDAALGEVKKRISQNQNLLSEFPVTKNHFINVFFLVFGNNTGMHEFLEKSFDADLLLSIAQALDTTHPSSHIRSLSHSLRANSNRPPPLQANQPLTYTSNQINPADLRKAFIKLIGLYDPNASSTGVRKSTQGLTSIALSQS